MRQSWRAWFPIPSLSPITCLFSLNNFLMSVTVSTSRFSRLMLESMAPTTHSQGQGIATPYDANPSSFLHLDSDDNRSDTSVEDEGDEDAHTVICSPATKISYDISDLDPETRSEIRQLFQDTSTASDQPQMVLQWCQLNQEQSDGQNYAFQLTENVPRSVRIGSSTSRYARPKCNCVGDSEKPCRHLIYVLDQLDYLTSDSLLDGPVRKLSPQGHSSQLHRPFDRISKYHLDLLASNLHCDVGSPESKTQPNPVRLQETREILATIANTDSDEYAVQHYRPDIFDQHDEILQDNGILSYDDLTSTIAKMLITNNDFFAYFLKLLGPESIARDSFRRIQQHVDRVLEELEKYSRNPGAQANTVEGPRDVPWAAAHLTRAVCTIQYLLQKREDAPSAAERESAARTLIRILYVVVFDWNRNLHDHAAQGPRNSHNENLYQALIGSRTDTSKAFILDTLSQLPEQNQWIETLEEIELRLLDSNYEPPETFIRRLRDLISLMRSSPGSTIFVGETVRNPGIASLTGRKRSIGGNGGRAGGPKRPR